MTNSRLSASVALKAKVLLVSLIVLALSPFAYAVPLGSLDISAVNFAESNNESGDFESILKLNFRTFNRFKNKKWGYVVEGDGFVATYPDFAIAVPEARLYYKTNGTEASIGRKKIKHINFLDEDWNLGVQTSFLRMEPFNPKEQGLLGFHYEINTDQVFVDLFASPVFIPDQSPGLDVGENGLVSSDNPWVFLPPRRVELSTGGILDVDYALVEDSLPELLSQPQFGGRFGIKIKDLSIMGMYYNRPSRQLDFDVTAKVESGDEAGFINVQAKPLFLREHFYGLQAESIWKKTLKVKNGFYGIIQQKSELSSAKFQTARYDYFFISTGLEFDLPKFKFSLRHLLTNKKQIEVDNVTYFENSRFLFEDAVSFEISELNLGGVELKLGGVYAYNENAAQVYISAHKKLTKRLEVYSSLNLIHDLEEDENSVDSNQFTPQGIGRFAALDNFRVGVSYVF